MKLFRKGERTETEIIAPDQSSFEWLDNSAKPEAEDARVNLQALFDQLPASSQPALAKRLRQASPDHDSVVAEIYFHEALRQCGYRIIPEPTTERGSRPEFQIELDGFLAYVEVTTDTGAEDDQKDTKAINDLIYRVSERVKTPGFAIIVTDRVRGAGNPSPRRFAKFLDDWFSGFNHFAERSRFIGRRSAFIGMPKTTYEESESGWRIEMVLWPLKAPDCRLKFIAGSTGVRGGWSTSRQRLTNNIRKKLRQHVGSSLPIVICIALNDFLNEPDQDDVVDVLLGRSNWNLDLSSDEAPIQGLIPDKIWTPRDGMRGRRPVGLVLARRIYAWSLMKAAPELWDNPNAPADQLLPAWSFMRWRWDVVGSGDLQNLPHARTTLAPVS